MIIKKLLIIIILFNSLLHSQDKYQRNVEISIEYDDFENITWYKPDFPELVGGGYRPITLYSYIGYKENNCWLRLVFKYESNSYLFIKNIILLYNGNKQELQIDFKDKREQIVNGGILETVDILVDDDLLKYLESYSKSDNAKLRFVGMNYYYNYEVMEIEKQGLQVVINKYKELKK